MLQKENRSEGVLKRGVVGEKSRGKPWAQGSGLRAQEKGLVLRRTLDTFRVEKNHS